MKSLYICMYCIIMICLISSSFASKQFIIKAAENYSEKDDASKEGQLTDIGNSRAECLVSLFGKSGTIAQVDSIFVKSAGTDKEGNIKVNSRKFTVEKLSADTGLEIQEINGDNTTLATLPDLLNGSNLQSSLFVWSDKEKAPILALNLGVANPPASFSKKSYGLIWVVENGNLQEQQMNCPGLSNKDESSAMTSKISYVVMGMALLISAVLLM